MRNKLSDIEARKVDNKKEDNPLDIQVALGIRISVPLGILSSKKTTRNITRLLAIIFIFYCTSYILQNYSPNQTILLLSLLVETLIAVK